MPNKFITFTSKDGKVLIPITHTDAIQYKNGRLTPVIQQLKQDVQDAHALANTAYNNVNTAYTYANIAYAGLNNILNTNISLKSPNNNNINVITRLYGDKENNRLVANSTSLTADLIKYNSIDNVSSVISKLQNQLNNIEINNVVGSDSISVDNRDPGITKLNVKLSDDTLKTDSSGLFVNNVPTTRITYSYIDIENKRQDVRLDEEIASIEKKLHVETTNRIAGIETLNKRINDIAGINKPISSISINDSYNLIEADKNGTAYLYIDSRNLKLNAELEKSTTDKIYKEDSIFDVLSKLNSHINNIDVLFKNSDLTFIAADNQVPNVSDTDILSHFSNYF